MTRNVIATVSYPGGGKTTFAQAWLAQDPQNRSRVSRDDLRAQLFNSEGVLSGPQEDTVTKVLNAQLVALLKAGKDVVVDATNLNGRFLKSLHAFCIKNGALSFKTHHITTEVEECVRRDRARFEDGGRGVGEVPIRGLAKRFPMKNWPIIDWQASSQEVRQYTGTPGKPKAWVADIDGTLAHMVDRGPHDTSLYHTDALSPQVFQVVDALKNQGLEILVTSGRSEDFRESTRKWLEANEVPFDRLIMRKSGDVRNDAIVKEELFWAHIAPFFDVQGCLDDRDRVVDKWREMGLVCFQVAPGNF